MKFKALSVKQPFANWICEGKKKIETRTWDTKYRGDLLICSSQNPKIEPYGRALCIIDLNKIEPMKKKHESDACCEVYPKAMAWYLRNVRKLDKPFPVKGKLGIYEIDIDDEKVPKSMAHTLSR